jgi:DNA/RNA-binding domain of Phe-tRNA-synthetase-like protein
MSQKQIRFQYTPDLQQAFPEARAAVIVGRGLQNGPSPELLRNRYLEEQAKVLAEVGGTPLSELERLSAWRSAFRRFNVNPTKYRSAVEALLRRLTKKGEIPTINTLVDICNLVSIRHRMPVAILDVARLEADITVKFARGDERFTPLFAKRAEHPDKGEVIFQDSSGVVVARRWCWRQSEECAARADTRDVIIVTEGHHPEAEKDLAEAAADLAALLSEFAGGQLTIGEIKPGNLQFCA